MSLESFYGGRIGASFIIVKRFDGIDIPQGSTESQKTYKVKYYATSGIERISGKDEYIYALDSNNNFIEKNDTNYNDKRYQWKITALNGDSLYVYINGVRTTKATEKIYAEGMVQCFNQGGSTTNTVNYGEYVIIDTPDKNNPDNGKVFRRGMNYQGDLGGAEYIGQVVGPQGPAPEVTMDHYEVIDSHKTDYYNTFNGEYTVGDNDLIPGVEYSGAESSLSTFNNAIKWITATLQDEWGNVNRCVIGFKIPYLVLEFEGNSINAYDSDYRQGSVGNWSYHNLILKDTGIDGFDTSTNTWKHPFFEKWQVKIPQGIHGINSTNIEIVHTKTMPSGFKKNGDSRGTPYYASSDVLHNDPIGYLENSVNIEREVSNTVYRGNTYIPIYNADDSVIFCQIKVDDIIRYVKKEDCYMDIIRYRETNFDNYEDGEIRFYDIGDYNNIQRITLSEEGVLTAFYSAVPTRQNLEEIIRWIYNDKNQDPETRTKGIEIDDWGTLQVNYNTKKNGVREVDRFPNQLKWIKDIQLADDGTVTITYNVPDSSDPTKRQKEVYDKMIDWITNVSLSQEGKFEVLFNNNTRGDNGKYTTTLEWIDFININEDGTIDFYLNTDHETPVYTSLLRLKVMDDIRIQTTNESGIEGTGDQKVHITYNTTHEVPDPTDPTGERTIPEPDTAIIGNPLNYIIETAVSMPSEDYPLVPYSHLLVYYSDPDLRQRLGGNISYPSSKVKDYDPSTGEPIGWHVWTEWVDLGDVRGSQNGIHIIKDVRDLRELQTGEPPRYMRPEEIKEGAYGWSVTYTHDGIVELLAYDYTKENNQWYSIGCISDVSIDPTQVMTVAHGDNNFLPDPITSVDGLVNNGFWFATETCKYAH